MSLPLPVQLFLLLLIVSSIVATWVIVFLNNKHKAPGATLLAIMLLTCIIWNIGYFIELVGRDFDSKMFGAKLSYFGIPFTPALWYLFVQQYVTHRRSPTRRGIVFILIIPTITCILAITTLEHNLFYLNPRMEKLGSFLIIVKEQGFWFQVHVFYSYLMLALGAISLYRKYSDQKSTFKRQSYFMLIAVSLPWLASIIYVFGMQTILPLDFTNAAFTLSGAFIGYTIFKYKLFELIPQVKEQIFDDLSVAIVACDPNFHIVEFNRAASEIFTTKPEIGAPLQSILMLTPQSLALIRENEYKGEVVLSGKTYTIHSRHIVYNPEKIMYGYSFSFTDISYLKEIEKGLESLNSTKDKFFSIIAHDLKNPFFGLIGFSNLLAEQIDTMDKREILQMVQYIQELSGSTYKMLENLLDWARTQTNAIEFQPKEVILSDLLTEAYDAARGNALLKNITLQLNLNSVGRIFADHNMIRTVLRNLVSNAIKFTPVDGHILAKVYANGTQVYCSIKDSGIGIAPEKLNNLFSLSSQTGSSGTAGEKGTGLGLIICKEFTIKNGGTIMVNSEPEKGTEFVLSFPAMQA